MGPEFLLNHINHQFEEQRDIFLRDNPELQGEYIHVNVAISNDLVRSYFDNVDQFDAACGVRGWRVRRDDPYRTEVRRRYRVAVRRQVIEAMMPEIPILYGRVDESIPMTIETTERTIFEPITQDALQDVRADVGEDGGFLVPPEVASSLLASLAPQKPNGYSVGRDEDGNATLEPCFLEALPYEPLDWNEVWEDEGYGPRASDIPTG